MSEPEKNPAPNWEREVLEKLALSAVQEQRRTRHWGILFKTLGFLYLFIVLFLAAGWFRSDGVAIPKAHTALVDLQGVIASDQVSADAVIGSLQSAFEDKNTRGVILRINSPGGSPVHAGQIYDEIRRLLTAGENKSFLDPFSPVDPEQQAFARRMLEEIHGQFVAVVREGRGKRLKETPETFSGLVWSGEKSIELGLADAYGTVESVARDVIKVEDIVDYTRQDSLIDRLAGRLGAGAAKALAPFGQPGVNLR